VADTSRTKQIALVVLLAVAMGALTALEPRVGAVFVLAAVFAGLFFIVDRAVLPIVTLGVLLVIPLDFMGPFSADLQGLPILGVAIGGALLSLLSPRRPLGEVIRTGWDVVVFTITILLAFSINGVTGGVRQALMLVAGVLFYFWVRASREPGYDTKTRMLRMLLFVGMVQGLAALVERLIGSSTFASLIPRADEEVFIDRSQPVPAGIRSARRYVAKPS